MGRRILQIFGMMLLALATAPAVRGQADEPKPPSTRPEPAPMPGAPDPLPAGLAPPNDGAATDGVTTMTSTATPGGTTTDQAPKKGRSAPAEPDPGASEWKGEQTPPRDDQVLQTQGTAPPAGAPAQGGADASLPTAERLPLGKQSVAVTVDVQAPATMNLTKEATLKLIVRNTGIGDAFMVRVDDELPDGLKFISSQPEMKVSGGGQHLSCLFNLLPGGSDRVITIRVQPTKTGPFDHTATVKFETGCKTRTTVLQPRLKVDIIANPTVGKVLKGQQVEFSVSIHNTGDGPARNVAIRATLSPGLKHESGPKGEAPMVYELTLPELPANAIEKLDPLVADAILGGEQSCTVTATSDDVLPNKDESECVRKIEVVEPKLKLALEGPEQRFTDTVADYKITLENPGTAPARKVRVMATLPISGRLVKVPPGASYEKTTSKIYWTIDQLDYGAKPLAYPFQVKMGGIGSYELLADAIGEGALKAHERKTTDVVGIADVDLVVSESKRVVDVGGQTTFQIRLRNYGTKDATRLLIKASLTPNLECVTAGGVAQNVPAKTSKSENAVMFEQIEKLGPNKEIILGIRVKVTSAKPALAQCHVSVEHDDLPEGNKFEDTAYVKITTQRRAAAAQAGGP